MATKERVWGDRSILSFEFSMTEDVLYIYFIVVLIGFAGSCTGTVSLVV